MTKTESDLKVQPGVIVPGETFRTPFEIDLAAAAKLGAKAEGVEIVTVKAPAGANGIPAEIPVAIRRGASPEAMDVSRLFEPWRDHPARKTGQALAQTYDAFRDLTMRHATLNSAIFADMNWRAPSMTSIIDYHENKVPGDADRGQHRIHYSFPLSEEWKAWVKQNGETMSQQDFAWFLEDRAPELSSPTEAEIATYERDFATTVATPAQLVALSRGLAVNVDTKVKAATTLATGEGQIAWEEVHNGSDGKPLKVPGIFILNVSPFFEGEKIRVPVRLRYRLSNGKVVWFYQIWRPDQAITEHVRNVFIKAKEETALPGFEGQPEMALNT